MQKWTEATKRFASACALLALAAGMARPAKAGGLGADTIGLFPQGCRRICVCGLEKGADDEVVPGSGAADAAGEVSPV